MLRCAFVVWLLALPWTAGCASSTDVIVASGATAELTVRVWSTAVQAPVPGRGTLVNVLSGETRRFDTSGLDGIAQTFTDLRPGLYEVRVEERWDGRRVKPARGSQQVYLEPDGEQQLDVTAVDASSDS